MTVSGGVPTLSTSYNITSITDTATGILTITIANDFSSANWMALAALDVAATDVSVLVTTKAAGSVALSTVRSNGAVNLDPSAWNFMGCGDL